MKKEYYKGAAASLVVIAIILIEGIMIWQGHTNPSNVDVTAAKLALPDVLIATPITFLIIGAFFGAIASEHSKPIDVLLPSAVIGGILSLALVLFVGFVIPLLQPQMQKFGIDVAPVGAAPIAINIAEWLLWTLYCILGAWLAAWVRGKYFNKESADSE
jgi:RsiW-degrading membrane proteinase PrsW (M82 family)